MSSPVLTREALNRATLARQMLLERADVSVEAAIARLFAMQSQLPRPPYAGLWSRLARFEPGDLNRALHAKTVVRATTLRATIHLLTTDDFLHHRAAMQPMLDKGLAAILKNRTALPDRAELLEAARARYAEGPCHFDTMRDHLQARWPEADERAMGYAVRTLLPLVMVPTDADWGFPAQADFTTSEQWLGRSPDAAHDLEGLVKRYLAAYGPATPKDMQVWSGIGNLKPHFEALGDQLVTFKGETGKAVYYDLPDAPRPDPSTPVPVRFLPEWDNLVLGHDDRTRVVSEAHRPHILKPGLRILATFLVDGFVAGTWRVERKSAAKLVLSPFETLAAGTRDALAAEAEGLLKFLEPGAKSHAIAFE